jgi:catechol 2,3-dioxygenase-like lactoylglutathione lyase family enzyme
MQIRLASVMVENQEDALRFYTTILGFVKNKDIPMGPFRWLTVSSEVRNQKCGERKTDFSRRRPR